MPLYLSMVFLYNVKNKDWVRASKLIYVKSDDTVTQLHSNMVCSYKFTHGLFYFYCLKKFYHTKVYVQSV